MNAAFYDLGVGLLFAAVLVYLLMVVNYQTFGDPFVVILALPATLCGILTMLFITGTTLNVPSLMGAIMAVGVASANSILLVTFAREQQLAGKTAFEAAIDAGHTRIRPVLMTAAAMIVGMIPMAIGGAGEEQNAALARAVIGGLLFATPTTLLIVPVPVRNAAQRQRRQDGTWRIRRGRRMNDVEPTDRLLEPADRAAPAQPPSKLPHAQGRWGGRLFALGVFSVLAAGLAFGAWQYDRTASRGHGDGRRSVATSCPTFAWRPCGQATGPFVVTLPATTLAFAATNINARATGYIEKRYADIGDQREGGAAAGQDHRRRTR